MNSPFLFLFRFLFLLRFAIICTCPTLFAIYCLGMISVFFMTLFTLD